MIGDAIWPYFAIVAIGFLPNEVWRVAGVAFSLRLDENSEVLVWVKAVATAILGIIIARLVLVPTGALAAIPLLVRVAAIVVGLGIFALSRPIFAGVVAGEMALLAGAWLRHAS